MRILITGMADGIGKALALAWAAPGRTVVGVDYDTKRGLEVVRAAQALGAQAALHPCDLSNRDQVDALGRTLADEAPFDVVVHNAGINCVGPFEATAWSDQRRVLSVNLEAPIALTGALLRSGAIRDRAVLVFISSLSHQVGYPAASVYASSKDGLTSYARSLDVALHPQRIRTLRVFPGPVRTAHAKRHSPQDSDASKRMLPAVLARKIVRAVAKRRRTLVPGVGPKVFAFVGRWLPGVTERALKKALYDPLVVHERQRAIQRPNDR